MTIDALLSKINAAGIRLRRNGGELAITGAKGKLDPSFVGELRAHKAALLDLVGSDGVRWWSPPTIRPSMLPLVELTQAEIDGIVAVVPGGARNVQDIYPLGPLQEGVLFHHLLATVGDPYLVGHLTAFESRERLDAYLAALQAVIARHDILRTAIAWEGLDEPVQVVWREARMGVEEVEIDPADGPVAKQLMERFDPRHHRIDVRRAPLMRGYVAHDPERDRFLLLQQEHHLISDHTTLEVLLAEVQAHLLGREAELPEPLPFRNFVAQARLGVSRAEHEEFFEKLLGDIDEPTAPFGLTDAWGDGSEIVEAKMAVDASLSARLRERARRLGVSAGTVCHVAYAQVLARVSGREDVVFGTVLFGRLQGGAGADRVMGPFINTLPVRVRVAEGGAEESVRRTHTLLAEVLRHEHASLALAQRCSGVHAPAPLFSALMNYRHAAGVGKPAPAEAQQAWEGINRLHIGERTNYPLLLSVDDLGDGFWLTAQAPASVQPERVCAMMHQALEGLVEALEDAPSRALGSIGVLPDAERAQVVEGWNATAADFPRGSSVHALFEAHVESAPDAVAVVFDDERITYAELNRRANRLAHHLRERGVGADARVAVLLPRSIELVVAELGLLKAGAAYVPIDPSYPADRIAFMVADSGSAVVLSRAGDVVRELPVERIDTDTLPAGDDSNPELSIGGEALAYVMYTSGSTGEPKGVMVPHRAITRLVLNNGYADFNAEDGVAFAANPAFDATTMEVWGPLLNGGRIVVISQDVLLDPARFGRALREQRVSVLWLTVGLFNQYAEELREELGALRHLIVGGDALDPRVIAGVLASNPPKHLTNGYGPTETTTFAVTHRIERVEDGARSIPLGRPVSNTRVYLLDARGEPVPVGVAGEMYIGGDGVARGYLNRPELTAERFVADPFSAEPARMYRTGDLGRWLADGTIEFLGRTDHQVKVRGYRIELGEIEACLAEHPEVGETVVLAREDSPGDKRLVAYYTGAAEAEALHERLSASLPEYMVPTAYVRLERLPLTPNGKVDRKALPAPDGAAYGTRGYEAPAGETEVALAAIWAEVLGVERVGRWDSFFELGGHSLLALQLISRVRQVLGVEAALGELFIRPVLADFARGVGQAGRAELPPIERVGRDSGVALSFAQRRLWFLEKLGGLGGTYHIATRVRLEGAMDRAALGRALDRIVARHEALRTVFAVVEGEPEQRIAPAEESGFLLLDHDLSGDADADAELRRLTAEESAAPFDLARGPLIRGRLVRLAPDDHLLLVTMHHIVSDGWSMGIFVEELSTLYGAFLRGDPDPLPELGIQYADYAAWQRKWVTGDVLQRQTEYWKATLAGAPELLELPTDHARPARQDHAGAVVPLVLDEETTAALKALSRRHGTTLFMTLLAGWSAVLGRLSGQDEVVIGTPAANRDRAEIEKLIGFFINTLPLRVDLTGEPTVAELLGRVKARSLEAQQHQDIPFEQVVELVQPARSMAHTPLFQVMFTWQNSPMGRLELPGLAPRSAGAAPHVNAKFDLTLHLQEAGGRIIGGMEYATALFGRATVERHLGYLRQALAAMAADERRRVDRLPILPVEERLRMTREWNDTAADFPRDTCVHELFAARAELTPQAVAVLHGGERMTYAELDARANRLAHALRERGVVPDSRVALCAERGPEMLVGLLAVLKAGGAYLPLDPAYPEDRLRFMVADSAPVLLLTQESLRGSLPELGLPVVGLEAEAWADQPATAPERGDLAPGHLAYVIYTSGSTGTPKGVLVSHRSLTHYAWWAASRYAEGAPLTFALHSSLAFDLTVTSVFVPLITGGSVAVHADGESADPAILRVFADDGADVVKLTPSHLALLDGSGVDSGRTRRMIVGGEDLTTALARSRVEASGGRLEILNEYGPTETTVGCTIHRFDPRRDHGASVPIGKPIANTRIYVLDRHDEPVPAGVAGEIFIGGAQVARGYLGRPELTAERFVADPFSGESGARMYRTGDRGRWLADGTLEFLGRNDFQLKIRGFRIEPGEIEARLAEHAAVRESVVLAWEDGAGERRLVAYYVAAEAIDAHELRAHLAQRLPEHMVPASYVHLTALPLTSNGKLDRKALPAPDGSAYATRGYEAPVGETEEVLAGIWAEVLGVERAGRGDDFFALGGHSLRAVRMISRVRQLLGTEVPLGELFLRPVLADFAESLDHALQAELTAIEPVERGSGMALSFAQQRLWFLEQMGGLGATYHVPSRLRLRGELDRAALGRALARIVARHEALRTVFHLVDGQPEQRIVPADESGFALVDHDLSGHPFADAELGRLMTDESGAAFDLEHGPLIRARLVRLAADDHVLLVTMHHIVTDGWSMGILVHELSVLYGAFRRGAPDPLPELPVQYADYAAWQRRWIEGDVLQGQTEYWKRTLAGAPELLELPTDRARPVKQELAGDSITLELGEELTSELNALSRRHGTTLFMTVLAGWAAVLARLSGQSDLVIGTPTANRGRAEIEGLIGFFVNTLALRFDLAGTPTVAELLDQVKARVLEAQGNQDIPFEQVVELAQPARSMAHTPLFQMVFAWQNTPGGRLELPGLTLGAMQGETYTTAKFDLTLSLQETGGRIVGGVVYASALYDRGTIERHLGYLRRVLEAMAADEHGHVESLALLPDEERLQVVEGWNATAADFPRESSVHALFEAHAESTPDAVAVVFDEERITYAELNRRANRLAHHLRERGVGADARVAVLLPRSIELVVAELGLLKAGAAYVPIDPTFPAERIAFMVADSGSPVVLSRAGETVPSLAVDRIDIDALPQGDESNPGLSLGSETLAYVMYTSGSTGEPKGVMVPHRAITRLVLNNGYADFNADDGVAFAANPAFDATTMEVWGPLLNGGRIVVISQDVLLDPARFGRALREQEVSVLWLTVGLFNQYAEELRDELGALRHLIVGGDALDPRVIAGVLASNPPKHLTNGYGPTETTTFAVTHRIERVEEGARSIPLGRPVSNTRVYLLDARGEPVPVGVAGEMYIGGDGVARGYLNRPELTAERFVADPFSAEPARMYRTGDLGRWLADGTIEFLGRTDHQVKVRGYRIELGEIEARLAEHAGIRDVVVLAREDVPGDKRLVAYCVGDDTLDAQTLRAHLAEQLPEYMVPAAYVWLERFPLTSNGKVDRRALPAPEAQAQTERGYEPPATETEIALAGIWAEVLGVERVGRWDDFFELGGHSLRAVQIVARVRQLLGTDVSLGELFVRPVLADFALVLEQAIRVELPPIEPAGRDGSLALSFAQQRLWFLEKLNDLGSTYHVPSRLRMHGELDREAMGRALDRIVARHETLRTTFAVVGSEPEQRIAPAAESRFHLVDHDLSGDADAAAELGRIMAEESRTTFDLERGPLLRGRLVRMAADDHVLLLTMHHIVTDGWSMGIFVQELTALYGAFRNGEPDPLPELAVQYADYAAWQRRATEGDVLQEQAEYWTRTLAGAPELIELPTDRPRPVKQEHGGASIALELDEELTAGLNALSRRHGTTLFMTLLAGWAAVLGRLSGQDEVVIGTPTANRGRAEVEGLIGFFINTLALRLDLSGTPTVAELLGRVKARALAAQQHQDIPFEQVVERVAPARSPAHTPLFQVMFTWQNAPRGALELPGLTLGSVEGQSQETAKLDLALTMWEAGGRIAGAVTYATSLYDAETVERYLGYLRGMLGEMVAGERRPVERLAILPAAERERVVVEWNAAEVEYPADACIHELFERQAELTPDGVAVFFDGRQLGYGELNRRANRLAHYLMELGVGADSRVVICVDRGLEMVVGMLAALKAGAAYVPLDPAYPVERLHYMFEDAAPSAMLTQASLAGLFRVSSVPVIDLGASQSMRGRHSEANPGREATGVTPEHLAYVIYTSGSTGEPKGVAVEHRQLASYTRAVIGRLGLEGGMRHALVSTMAADLGNTVLYPALCTGGTLHVVAPETATSAERFTAYMARHEIDVLKIVPSHLAALLFGTEGTDGLPRRRLVLGGEASSRAWVRELRERAPEMAIANHYGPTETTVGVLVHPDAGADEGTGTVPLGRPLPGTRVYVLDRGGEPVPTGAAGELCVGGAQVARGYLRRPALTAERFVPDPFSAEPGARMYRTGDLARWLANGTVEFLGRTDFQVKVRGFRIEPGEIESRLAEHSGVREAIVVAREDTPGDRRLVAYCVGDVALESQEMRTHLSERLPEHMVPAAYVWLDRLPLTPNGKVDRRALPAPDGTAYVTRGYEPPVGETEEILAEIWMDMLEVERVGRQDNFFELGGHSLLAVQIISQIKSILGADVEMQEIFTYTTIESLALRVQGTEQAVETDGAIAVRRTGSEPALFIVHDGSGSVGYAQVLHRHIRAEVPVYSLPDTPPSEPRLRTIEGMAARLARMVREVQPNGPYRLAGWSFGGIIAYQVAVQLIGENQEVEFLGLMDTKYGGVDGVADVVDDRSMLLHVIHTVDGLAAATLAKLTELVTGDTTSDLETLVRKCQAVAHLPTAVSAAEIQQLQNRLLVYRQAQHEYDPQPIGIPIDLFTAMESTDPDPLRGWEALLPTESIRITPVPGTHFTMMETPDVESLGRAMSSAISPTGSGRSVAEPESPLVRLRFGKTGGAPLFCVPGAGGSVTSFADLASAIDAEWPVHGLQPRGVDGENVAHSTVEAAAEFYLGAVEAMQPTGPVHLLGHSFGGWVAFEMAQRLRRSGRAVGSLTLLDTEVPTEDGSAAVEHDSGEALLALVEVFELTLGRSIDIGAGEIELLDHAARLGLLHERLVRFGVVPRNSGHDVVRGPFRAFASSLRATYRPSDIYLEPLRLVLVSDPRHDEGENQAAFAKIVRGWKQRAPNVMFTVGRGNHFTALKPPHVASLASLLAADR